MKSIVHGDYKHFSYYKVLILDLKLFKESLSLYRAATVPALAGNSGCLGLTATSFWL